MLGVIYTYINCDRKDCRYRDNEHNICNPPLSSDHEFKEIDIINGICKTYKHKNRRKKVRGRMK